MLQLLMKKGKIVSEDVPPPVIRQGSILIQVSHSCISTGTELSGLKSNSESVITKGIKQPSKLKNVWHLSTTIGLKKTISKVRNKLDTPFATGYSLAGTVIDIGEGITKFKKGDRVAAAGTGHAFHAEHVNVPENLVTCLPESIDFKSASTAALGSIALQGVRRGQFQVGDIVAVIGTGAIGLLTIQLLQIAGIRTIAIDVDASRLAIAESLGAEHSYLATHPTLSTHIDLLTNRQGIDGAIVTASSSENTPLSLAFQLSRKKGRVVLVGDVKMAINREEIYEKELDFLISTSYGPGRYDSAYEEQGNDYPFAYVRWTENRNMSEYLRLIATKRLTLDGIIGGVFPIEKAHEAFLSLQNVSPPALLALLSYPEKPATVTADKKCYLSETTPLKGTPIRIGMIGAGAFAQDMHIPNITELKSKFNISAICCKTSHKAKQIAKQTQAHYATCEPNDIITDKNIDLVFICTQHDSHAGLTLAALKHGKHVFVEKPLAIHQKELSEITTFMDASSSPPVLMVGYNRRFSPFLKDIYRHTKSRQTPLFIRYRMNVGLIPETHWVHTQGGRFIGEACHIIDLFGFLTDSEIIDIKHSKMSSPNHAYTPKNTHSIIISYADGSICSLDYFELGSPALSKEFMEIHCDGQSIILDNYQTLNAYHSSLKTQHIKHPNKGHKEMLLDLYRTLSEKQHPWPISWDSLYQTSYHCINIAS